MLSMMVQIAPWYVAIQLCTAAALPLALRLFGELPDRGYAAAKILGIFLVGVTLWVGTSYGLLRNEFGGAMLALGFVAVGSYAFGGYQALQKAWGELRSEDRRALWTVLWVEGLFLVAFLVWAVVRAHDPAANHTEQPMDLMFMNSIWTSPTFPPRDAWMAGYPISYYYLGYWLLTTLGHLSSTPPAIAYNVGQASWFGLLLITAYGLGFNLLGLTESDNSASYDGVDRTRHTGLTPSVVAGLCSALFVGVIGNMQVVLEWLYAAGADLQKVASWLAVNGFPQNAQQSGDWFIGYGWWWWRSSRVVSDQDLLGGHIEVIDEFPMFSYLLGDNHPHLLAMPVVILVLMMALGLYLRASRTEPVLGGGTLPARALASVRRAAPMGAGGIGLIAIVSGGLVFLNTWDYPPYWLLLVGSLYVGLRRAPERDPEGEWRVTLLAAVLFGMGLVIVTLVMYLPYFLTAQSQAGGFVPNLFNPTRVQQAALMFGVFVPAITALLYWGWRLVRPSLTSFAASVAMVFGLPVAFLIVSALLAAGTSRGRAALARMPLPEGATGYLPFIVERWTGRPYTFLLLGLALATSVAILWALTTRPGVWRRGRGGVFVLLVTSVAVLLVYLPEFVYLRDNFGTRMNTVFKFYYQAWLLMAIAASYVVVNAIFGRGSAMPRVARALGMFTLVFAIAALLFPIAGTYAKTLGFANSASGLDATAYVAAGNPAEMGAVAWILANTNPDDIVLEGKGGSYNAADNRISTMTGRATLLGWDGHESQWRGEAFGEMAAGRSEAIEGIYESARADEIPALLDAWNIGYVYVGPAERQKYDITPRSEERLAEAMELVYDAGNVAIYRRR